MKKEHEHVFRMLMSPKDHAIMLAWLRLQEAKDNLIALGGINLVVHEPTVKLPRRRR